jgi:hypothetical protein
VLKKQRREPVLLRQQRNKIWRRRAAWGAALRLKEL